MQKPKVLFFDIEATNLSANFGFMLCFGYKWAGQKNPTIISIRDFPDAFKKDCTTDKHVVEAAKGVMDQADMVVSWYGQRYDVPFIQTRLLAHNLKPLLPVPHVDGWRIAKYQLKFNSNRLDTVQRSIPNSHHSKTPIENRHWVRAAAGHIPSIKYVEKHCRADIQVLEEVYNQLRPFAKNLPSMALLQGGGKHDCPACGSSKTRSLGRVARHKSVVQRRQCLHCGHSFMGATIK